MVVYETPNEVRAGILQLFKSRQCNPIILSEAQSLFPAISHTDIDNFLTDKKMEPKVFSSCLVALYCFLERYREELGTPKSRKRVILEQLYSQMKSSYPNLISIKLSVYGLWHNPEITNDE